MSEKEKVYEKRAIGVRPKKLWIEERLSDLYRAIACQFEGTTLDWNLINKWHKEATKLLKEIEQLKHDKL